jgi:hypothetical protein
MSGPSTLSGERVDMNLHTVHRGLGGYFSEAMNGDPREAEGLNTWRKARSPPTEGMSWAWRSSPREAGSNPKAMWRAGRSPPQAEAGLIGRQSLGTGGDGREAEAALRGGGHEAFQKQASAPLSHCIFLVLWSIRSSLTIFSSWHLMY